ncbi:MAG: patatin-like phospholipase family protein [Spirochaetes bacterium]|jgi:NTE family protein|nr:patatin-like phospholipase family protein [Spirochaetota bacterium]
MRKRKKIGLVLGSGSSRGWAHIGVIEALEEAGIRADFIAGCSIGSFVGAVYAGRGLARLKEFVLGMDGKKSFSYFDVVFPRSGFLDGDKKLREILPLLTDAKSFADLDVPLRMVATDLDTGERVVLKSGSVMNALRASMSYPGLFSPARHGSRWLVDGGLVDPVPVGVARDMGADIVIAVDLNSGLVSRRRLRKDRRIREASVRKKDLDRVPFLKKVSDYYEGAGDEIKKRINSALRVESGTPHILETIISSLHIMQEEITRMNLALDPPDLVIRPRLADLSMMDFDQVDHAIREGYNGMKERMRDIESLL